MSRALKVTLIVAAIVVILIIGVLLFNIPTESTGHDEGPTALIMMNH